MDRWSSAQAAGVVVGVVALVLVAIAASVLAVGYLKERRDQSQGQRVDSQGQPITAPLAPGEARQAAAGRFCESLGEVLAEVKARHVVCQAPGGQLQTYSWTP